MDRERLLQRRARVKRRIGIAVLALALSPFAIVGLFWLWMQDFGFHTGYFGRLNRTLDGIKDLAGTKVLASGGNRDTTFEEMWVNVEVGNRYIVYLFFPEDIELSNASSIVISSVNNTPLGSAGPTQSWSGPQLTLGATGNVGPLLQGRLTLSELLSAPDTILKWVESTPINQLQQQFEPSSYPPGSVLMQVWDTTIAKPILR